MQNFQGNQGFDAQAKEILQCKSTTLLTQPVTSVFSRTWSKHYVLPIAM